MLPVSSLECVSYSLLGGWHLIQDMAYSECLVNIECVCVENILYRHSKHNLGEVDLIII